MSARIRRLVATDTNVSEQPATSVVGLTEPTVQLRLLEVFIS